MMGFEPTTFCMATAIDLRHFDALALRPLVSRACGQACVPRPTPSEGRALPPSQRAR
jgi:hypothetical protein